MEMKDKVIKEIWELYFDEMYSYEELIEHFNNKYSYAQIRSAIDKKYGR